MGTYEWRLKCLCVPTPFPLVLSVLYPDLECVIPPLWSLVSPSWWTLVLSEQA